MLITQSALSHVCKLDCAFRACVHEPIAALWMELSSRDHLCQLLHICWFDVNNVEALVLDIQVPQVYPQIIAANEGFAVTVH
jgi:hypothetical protein